MSDSLSYAVVFEYTAAAGGYAGVRTWTAFKSQADFEKWLKQPDNKVLEKERVIAQGVTDEEAIRITEGTPVECYAAACIEEATGRSGHINEMLLEAQLSGAAMAVAHSGRDPLALVTEAERLLREKGLLVID